MTVRNAIQASEDPAEPSRSPARWRQLHSRLWAGRMNDRPVGTIEQGHGFVFVDLNGDRHTGYSTLEDAKDAATGPIRLPPRAVQRPGALRLAYLLAAVVVVLIVLVTVWAVLRS